MRRPHPTEKQYRKNQSPLWLPQEIHGSDIVDRGEATRSLLESSLDGEVVDGEKLTVIRSRFAALRKWTLGESVRQFRELLETTKSEDDGDFPAAAYAYVPDASSPSTWKLRLWAKPSGGPDARIVGDAIAALGKGYRGERVEIPARDLPAVKAKVRAAWKKANPDKESKDMPSVIAD